MAREWLVAAAAVATETEEAKAMEKAGAARVTRTEAAVRLVLEAAAATTTARHRLALDASLDGSATRQPYWAWSNRPKQPVISARQFRCCA